MLRTAIASAAAFLAGTGFALADVWMVKSSGQIGCRDRDVLVRLESAGASATPLPDGCVVLYSGERLLDQSEIGIGFADYIRVQRGDGGVVFVRTSALVSDPGIGSVTDDRAE